jgi:hypothetical protein
MKERTAERTLGGFVPQHRILIGRQQLAPFGIAVRDLEVRRSASGGSVRRTEGGGRACDTTRDQTSSADHVRPFLCSCSATPRRPKGLSHIFGSFFLESGQQHPPKGHQPELRVVMSGDLLGPLLEILRERVVPVSPSGGDRAN